MFIQAANSINDNEGWIGYNDIDSEYSFTWSDGTPNSYTNWKCCGEPNDANDNEDCTEINGFSFGLWNDVSCTNTRYYFVCNNPNPPTLSPTASPTPAPTNSPTNLPSQSPTYSPTILSMNYIGIYAGINGITWYNARTYCINTFGTDLASIHSSNQNTDASNVCLLLLFFVYPCAKVLLLFAINYNLSFAQGYWFLLFCFRCLVVFIK